MDTLFAKSLLPCEIRQAWPYDRAVIQRIEDACFQRPLSEEDFSNLLDGKKACARCLIADCDDETVAFVVFEYCHTSLHILDVAVLAGSRRRGVGSALVSRVLRKCSGNRNRVITEVRERNLGAQLFFRFLGFRWIRTLRGFCSNSEDAYQMVWRPKTDKRTL